MSGLADEHSVSEPLGTAALALADPDVRAAVRRFAGPDSPTVHFAEEVADRRVEYDGIVELLCAHATPRADPSEVEIVADAIAAGCLGEQHLWRDLGLPSKSVLRKLFEGYFESLAADNIMDMRWKKYVYRRLCRWGGFHTCKAPSCGVCADYTSCFGPEL